MGDWDTVVPEVEYSKTDISKDVQDQVESDTSSTRAKIATLLIEEFTEELRKAHKEKYDIERAELTAALCLSAQYEISEFLAEAELLAKEKKAEVEAIEGERFFYYKENYTGDKKPTDATLKHMVAKDPEVRAAQREQFKAEAEYNKWRNLFNTLKDGHIFFRALMKGKSEF